jgi:ApaG protein
MTQPPQSNQIDIQVSTRFLAEQSEPAHDRFAFAYTIAITNRGTEAVRLLSRYWLITDGNNEKKEVHGEGVVGEQPYIPGGDTFEYTSGAMLNTAVGTMEGSYQMVTDSGDYFDAVIPRFSLIDPKAVH